MFWKKKKEEKPNLSSEETERIIGLIETGVLISKNKINNELVNKDGKKVKVVIHLFVDSVYVEFRMDFSPYSILSIDCNKIDYKNIKPAWKEKMERDIEEAERSERRVKEESHKQGIKMLMGDF